MILFLAAHTSWLKLASDTQWQVFRQQGQRYTSHLWTGDDRGGENIDLVFSYEH